MSYAAVTIPSGVWGVDVDCELTDALLDVLLKTDLHTLNHAIPPGTFVKVIWRYVGLGGPAKGDISPLELQRILARPEKPILVLVQHVEAGSWIADGPTGTLHGKNGAADAKSAGYNASLYPGLSLACDMESVKNPGPSALLYLQDWLNEIAVEWFGEVVYEGFDAGVTGQQLLDLHCPLWSDAGPRVLPANNNFACKQHPQVKIGGVWFDLDYFQTDSRGYAIVGLQDVADVNIPDVEPANPITSDPHV